MAPMSGKMLETAAFVQYPGFSLCTICRYLHENSPMLSLTSIFPFRRNALRQRIPVGLFILACCMLSCNYGVIDLDVQGHRGCRGLMPENSIPAFEKAWELGVTTLEMDVVITRDRKVVVSQ
jgi:hypothetical protein